MGNTVCCAKQGETISLHDVVDVDQALKPTEAFEVVKASQSHLGWREAALADPPLHGDLSTSDEAKTDLTEQFEVLRVKVGELLTSPGTVGSVHTGDVVSELRQPGADWSQHVHMCFERVKQVNALGGPRMQVVWWGSLKALGQLPRWPEDHRYILDAEYLLEQWVSKMGSDGKIEGRSVCISAFSHRWERPSLDVAAAHPDTEDNRKAKSLAEYGRLGTCPIFDPYHIFDYYFWIDFAGVNQADFRGKMLGVCKLPAFFSACVELIIYNSSTTDYEPRAWTRLERAVGYTYCMSPLIVYLDDKYPCEELDIDAIVDSNPGAFKKDPETGVLQLRIRDPCSDGAAVTDKRDLGALEIMKDAIAKATPLNPMRIMACGNFAFGRTMAALDTEHYNIDARGCETRLAGQLDSMGATQG